VVIDNLRYDQWKTFESEVTTINWKRSPLFLYSSYGDQYARNAFSGHHWKWKSSFRNTGKTIPKKAENLYEAEFYQRN
jgi:hypothetical protein